MFSRDNIRKTFTVMHYPVFEHLDTLPIAFLVSIILYIDGKLFRCSVFTFVQYIMNTAGDLSSIKILRSSDLLIQCAKESYETNILKMKKLCGLSNTVALHSSLNTSKGIVPCPVLNRQTREPILEFMGEHGVTAVRRIKPIYTLYLTSMHWLYHKQSKLVLYQQRLMSTFQPPVKCLGRPAVCIDFGEL